MIKFNVKQNKNTSSSVFGKYFAYPVIDETMDLEDLAEHMEDHNSGFSKAICLGVMTAMVRCIKEQLLEGKNVKINDLAIFSVGLKNKKGGSETEEDFSASTNISGVKLRARATGTLSNANLNVSATLKKASSLTASSSSSTKVTITTAVNDENMGSVKGGGTYTKGTSVTLTAVPSEGFSLEKWEDGSTLNPRTVTASENATYTATFQIGTGKGEV